ARIAVRRGAGVLRHVPRKRARRLEAADAAAQRAVLGQGDEGRAGLLQPRLGARRGLRARGGALDRLARERKKRAARLLERDFAAFMEAERRVADHLPPAPRGIARIACAEKP